MTLFKKYRIQRGYTLEEVAESINVSWRNLQRIENGKYKTAKYETIKSLFNYLKIPDKEIINFIKEEN